MDTNLTATELSLRDAGRQNDADVIAKARALLAETGEWIACLRCGMSFPTATAQHRHYDSQHPFRSYASRGMAAPLGGSR